MNEPTGILDERDLIRGARLREQQQAAERLHLVADAVARDEQARLGAPDGLDGRPLDERVVHEQRAVAGQEQVAHEGLDDVGRVEQRAGPRRDAQAAGVGGERLRALDAGLDLLVEGAGQVVAIAAETVVAQAGRGRAAGTPATRVGRSHTRAAPRPIRRSRRRAASSRSRRRRWRTACRRCRRVGSPPPNSARRKASDPRGAVQRQRDADARAREAAPQLRAPARRCCRRRSGRSSRRGASAGIEPGIERRLDRSEHRVDRPAASAPAGAACAGRPAPRPGRRGIVVAIRSQPASTSTRDTAANICSSSEPAQTRDRCSSSARW